MIYNSATMIDVKSAPYNATGNGTTDDSAAINAAYTAAVLAGKNLYFPAGTYFTVGGPSGVGNIQNVILYGDTPSTSIIKQTALAENNVSSAQDLGFLNFKITDYGVQQNCFFINCAFTVTIGTGYIYYMLRGFYTAKQNVLIDNCTFNFNQLYSAIWCDAINSVAIKNCTFIGPASHVIRINSAYDKAAAKKISIQNNYILSNTTASTTGIFVAGNRQFPWIVNISGNTVINTTEEGISFDGFGNNAGLCPTICNGNFGALSNDSNGRLVVGMDNMLYYGSASNQPMLVSNAGFIGEITANGINSGGSAYTNGTYTAVALTGGSGTGATATIVVSGGIVTSVSIVSAGQKYLRGDLLSASLPAGSGFVLLITSASPIWTNFYFSMGPGSNYEGSIFLIYDFNTSANTITLDTKISASSVGSSGYGGVQSGFFNCVVRDNYVSGAGTSGISMYLNVFNCIVDNNTVVNSSRGIGVFGGQMLSTYNTCSYNNVVVNNKVLGCNYNGTVPSSVDNAAVGFISLFGGQVQYNNSFTNNTVVGGGLYIQKQQNFVLSDNSLNTLSMLVTTI
jgi:hypothetical protein